MGENKKYEIIQGDGKGLDISPAEDHINDLVNKRKEIKKEIIVPKTKEEQKK